MELLGGWLSEGFLTVWRESLRGSAVRLCRFQQGTWVERDLGCVTALLTAGSQRDGESLGALCEHNELAMRSPSGCDRPMHMRLQNQGL